MLIVFLLRTILSETIKLSGASRRHVALHPAAISTRARSFHREYANNVAFATPGFGSPTRATGICTSLMRSQISSRRLGDSYVSLDVACRIMHSPTRDPMPLMKKPTYLFRVRLRTIR